MGYLHVLLQKSCEVNRTYFLPEENNNTCVCMYVYIYTQFYYQSNGFVPPKISGEKDLKIDVKIERDND